MSDAGLRPLAGPLARTRPLSLITLGISGSPRFLSREEEAKFV